VRAIAEADADVVCLQETTPEWERAVRQGLGKAYPYIRFHDERAAGGMALLSKWELEGLTFRRTEAGWFPACIATVNTPAGPVRVVSVHLRPPVSDGGSFVSGHFTAPAIHEKEIALFCQALDRNLPTLVVGDFNEEEDGRAVDYLARGACNNWRMTSALPLFAPDRPTWRWPTTLHTFERRLDHIIFDGRLEPLSVEVLDAGRSDHFPVVGVFARARVPL
jgi:endonuclease/exonuclease/phosphatase family metal-dependent hydrolase